MRKDWDSYFMDIAEKVSTRSTCDRLHVGCILVKNNKIIGTGYNGSLSNTPHCDDVGHLYNDVGRCIRTIHAEQNAIIHAVGDLNGATAYVTAYPCENCSKLLVQAGIKKIVYHQAYANKYSEHFLQGIELVHLKYNMSEKPNTLFIVTGHSGTGKTSVMRQVLRNEIVSVTTRNPRDGEIQGRDYYFISEDEYENKLSENNLVQRSSNYGKCYGIERREIENKLKQDHAFAIVNYDGMLKLKEQYPDAVTIFLYTGYDHAIQQMQTRGDNESDIIQRMSSWKSEIENKNKYDYIVRNQFGKMDDVIDVIRGIVKANS